AAMAQEHPAVGVLPTRIAGGKVGADVAQREGAEDRVTQGVDDHVAIGMGHHAAVVWDADAAERDVVALAEGVDVITLADTDAHVQRTCCAETWGGIVAHATLPGARRPIGPLSLNPSGARAGTRPGHGRR